MEFDFSTKYIKGEFNIADGLSRQFEINTFKANQIVVISDPIIKERILKEYHLLSGHGTIQNMKFLIKEKYSWEKINYDIEEFYKSAKLVISVAEREVTQKVK